MKAWELNDWDAWIIEEKLIKLIILERYDWDVKNDLIEMFCEFNYLYN